MNQREPLVLDPAGRDRPAVEAALHAGGSATLVDVLGVRAWSVSEPELLTRLLTDPRVSKDASQHWPRFINGEILGVWPLDVLISGKNMLNAYGPDHRRLRRLVSPAFTPRRTTAMVPRIEQLVATLLDSLADTPPGQVVDLRAALASPLPIQVIGGLMGLRQEDGPQFRDLVDGVVDTTQTPERATANYQALYGMLGELVARKRAEPGDDITSVLIAARDDEGDGSSLTEEELLDTLHIVIGAGYETTVNLIDQAVTALLTHPEQRAHLHTGRATWDDVIEETLRYASPLTHWPLRYAVEDIKLPDGTTIPQGEAIIASYGVAGRHPTLHGDTATKFDLTRTDKQHLAFGHGMHFCLGAPLARAEAKAALPALFHRFPDLRLAVPVTELEPVASLLVNGHRTLPVHLTAAPR